MSNLTSVPSSKLLRNPLVRARIDELYWLPRIPRCGRVNLRTYHVWGKRDAGIFFSRRTRSGRAAALGPRRERAGVPAGFDDREPAGGHGTQASGAPGWARPVGSVRVAQPL